jgi:hypothetical protein
VVAVQGQADLLEIVEATGPLAGSPNHLDCWQDEADQRPNDGDEDQ